MKSRAKKNSVLPKILSALLCLCMLSSLFQTQILGASALIAPDVHITQDGKRISSIVLPQTDKAVLSAEVSSQSGSTEFQWQLLSDISSDEWINIYDATSQTLNLSYLTVESLLDNAGSVYLRACAQNGKVKGYSDPVSVTVQYNVPADETSFLSPTLQTVTNAKAAAASSEYVNIAINYLDALSGQSIYTSYTAQIQRGTSYTNLVVSPTYLGYAAYYNKSNLNISIPDEGEVDTPDDATIIKLDIPESYSGDNYVINVYYKPIDVLYAAKYFFQNVNDDFYSEDYSLYKKAYAKTGTIISNSDLEVKNPEKIKGFTKLYHYPESVAADGSTVFECYYDRNYYFIKFDMDGGYGLDPIYARYDTPFVVKNPTKHGYTFEGWDLLENGVGDGVADVMPTNIPNENRTYKALWKAVNSKYTTVYWLQNPDDDNYSYKGQITRYADADTVVSGSDDLTETTLVCGNDDEDHTHTDVCYPEDFDRIEFEKADQNVVVKGDGSTIVNVYYTRKYYTLRFIYAKEYNGIYDYYNPGSFSGIRYYVIGGSTYGFGNPKKSWPNNKYGQDYNLEDLLYNLSVVGSGEQWGCIYETYDQVEDKSKLPQIIEPDIKNAKYSTGVYPEPGTGYQQNGKGNGDYTYRGDRFYYFDLTARYGADLTKLWPASVFDKIKVAHPDRHVGNGGANNLENDGWGNYAYLAGWNGEFKVTYSIENTNTTVKGLYQKLDDNLLFGALSGQDKFTYGDDRTITTTATVGGKTVTSYVNYYINFFNNGSGVSWNIPREWNYDLFVPVFDGELTDDQIAVIKQYGNDAKTYDIDGNTYYYYKNNDAVYRLYDHIVTSDDGTLAAHQTQPALSGFELESGSLSDYCRRAEKISNGKLSDGRQSYTLRFFYQRDTFGFVMHNHSSIYYSNLKAEFDSDLDTHVYKNGKQVVPDYPQTLEPGAYEFKGWYTTTECYDGSEYTKGTKMPANNLALYAKWAPKPHTVRFFQNYEAMLNYQKNGDESGLIEEKTVLHGNVVGDINNPIDSENSYSFSGWFFTKADNMVAFNPTDTAINGDMNIFADWGSQSAQPYILNYVLDKPETDSAIIALLNKASEGTPKDNKSYTITDDGAKKTYVYLEADGKYHLSIADSSTGYAYQGNTRTFYPKVGDPYNQLNDGYNQHYYPTVSSHSITIQYESDKADVKQNIYTFTYVYKDKIDYTVEYRYLESGELISSAPGNGSVDKTTSLSVVTERFAVVTNYMPDAFYKRLILAVEKDDDGNVVSSKSNVVVFYYSENSSHAYYAVHHMLQNVDAETDEPQTDSDGNYTNYTENTAHTEGIGEIGKEISVAPQNFIGFTVYNKGLVKGDSDYIDLNDPDSENPYFNITAKESGTELYIFYTRNIQNYKIYHLRYGTDVSDLDLLEYTDKSNGVLLPIETGSAKNGTTITAYCKGSDEIPGMTCVSEFKKSIVLYPHDEQNYIIFYYSPIQYTVEYKVWQYGGGTLDNTIEVVNGTDEFSGSTPTAASGYKFEGWYLDDACTIPAVSTPADQTDKATLEGDKLIPTKKNISPSPKTNVFYSKFTPTYANLTITRNNGKSDEGNGTQTYIYKVYPTDNPNKCMYVTLTGNDSVTIKDLPCAEYTVEQSNDWSWRYYDDSQNITLVQGENSVVFDQDAKNKLWLNGNSRTINNRKE